MSGCKGSDPSESGVEPLRREVQLRVMHWKILPEQAVHLLSNKLCEPLESRLRCAKRQRTQQLCIVHLGKFGEYN